MQCLPSNALPYINNRYGAVSVLYINIQVSHIFYGEVCIHACYTYVSISANNTSRSLVVFQLIVFKYLRKIGYLLLLLYSYVNGKFKNKNKNKKKLLQENTYIVS